MILTIVYNDTLSVRISLTGEMYSISSLIQLGIIHAHARELSKTHYY